MVRSSEDIDIAKKLEEREIYYNCHCPNFALKGKTLYEVLREKLLLTLSHNRGPHTQSPNHPITQSPSHPVTQSPNKY
jgi:hypothetical protein